jgi:hypothetical protein
MVAFKRAAQLLSDPIGLSQEIWDLMTTSFEMAKKSDYLYWMHWQNVGLVK